MTENQASSDGDGIRPAETFMVPEQWPLPPHANLDDVVSVLQEVTERPGRVKRIIIESGQPIHVERIVSSAGHASGYIGEEPFTAWQHIRNNAAITDYEFVESASAAEGLFEMLLLIHAEGLAPTKILAGSVDSLRSWLSVPEDLPMDSLFGISVENEPELPGDTFLVCGALSRLSTVREIRVALKGVIP